MNVLIIGSGGREHAWRGKSRKTRALRKYSSRPATPVPL